MASTATASGERRRAFGSRLYRLAETLLMVAASTVVGLLIAPRWGTAPIVLLYLPPVLGAAILFGLWPALVAAVASTLAYDFYFTEPYGTLVIDSPAD
ncbi:MAG TPA: DUF4118 domain-containing protein, partial [Croceibacterium sp.]|nr:DUF4118 domain-containing protein [Croceibacterium sp.]